VKKGVETFGPQITKVSVNLEAVVHRFSESHRAGRRQPRRL
jgi:hypothetical protein